MDNDTYCERISKGLNPWKVEHDLLSKRFNDVSFCLDKIIQSDNMTDELKVKAIENIADSMAGREHHPFTVEYIDPKQKELEF